MSLESSHSFRFSCPVSFALIDQINRIWYKATFRELLLMQFSLPSLVMVDPLILKKAWDCQSRAVKGMNGPFCPCTKNESDIWTCKIGNSSFQYWPSHLKCKAPYINELVSTLCPAAFEFNPGLKPGWGGEILLDDLAMDSAYINFTKRCSYIS
jgi:hypothetical protein